MDPIREAARYYDNLAYEDELRMFIEKKMKAQKQECIDYLRAYVCPTLVEDFSKILASAYALGCPIAEKIARQFNFNQEDFFAIEENFDEFKKDLLDITPDFD